MRRLPTARCALARGATSLSASLAGSGSTIARASAASLALAALPAVLPSLVLAALPAFLPSFARAAPVIALTDCRLPHPMGTGSVAARCGRLAVAEDPREPQGRQISLHVAVVPALDRRTRRQPLFVLAGGPGQAASDFYAAYAAAFAPIQRSRDLVLLDQRGTGGSNRLDCEFPEDFETRAPAPDLLRKLAADCRAGLPGRPEFYTTSIAVGDLERVRAALGYDRIALYGVSYGTRVAQHYVRRHPERVHAVVLDGVVAPDVPLGTETPFDAQRALDLMFARCAADAPCARAFPDLKRRFDGLRGRLAESPVPLTVADPATAEPRELTIGAEQLTGVVRLLNYFSSTTAILPLLIDRAASGDLVPLASQLVVLGRTLDAQMAYGMNAAVACTEDVRRFGTIDRARYARTYFGASQIEALLALCEGWPAGVVDGDLHTPLRDSPVPALLLSGEADPVTPPANGARAVQGFRDALHVVVKGQGHGQLGLACATRAIEAFLVAGTTHGLDVGCLRAAAPTPFFVDAAGPMP